ncbi:MAG: hypothetical protein ABI678_10725, partial [Kofleriaceae bacterium]
MKCVAFLVLAVACSARSSSPTPPPVPQHSDAAVSVAPAADQREVALAHEVVELLERRHLRGRPLDDTISAQAFATYLDRLDASKLFLLASDREKLSPYRDKIDDELRSGNLELAHLGQSIFLARVAVVEKIVAS